MSSKSMLIILSYTIRKLARFLRHSVVYNKQVQKSQKIINSAKNYNNHVTGQHGLADNDGNSLAEYFINSTRNYISQKTMVAFITFIINNRIDQDLSDEIDPVQ